MKATPPYSAAAIKKFVTAILRPRVASDFVTHHENRALVRQRCNFAQLIALSGGRYGETLKALPTFYVVGARPSDAIIPQSVSLHADEPHKWRFQGRQLDEHLADDICRLLVRHSPLSYFAPFGAADVVEALKCVAKKEISEDAPLFLAFFMFANGISGGEAWIEKARRVFLKQNPIILHDWQRTTLLRIEELERRHNLPNAANLCQAEAQDQAMRLGLPRIEWLASEK